MTKSLLPTLLAASAAGAVSALIVASVARPGSESSSGPAVVAPSGEAPAVASGLETEVAALRNENRELRARVEALERGMLQRSAESLTLVRRGYEAGEISYVELLTAQRTAFETNLEYLEAVGELNAGLQLLRGNLLFDSLGAETAP